MDPFPGCRAGIGVVRSKHDIVHFSKGTILGEWFNFENILSGSGQLVGLESSIEMRFFIDGSARCID